jgi:Domain of unknown function (DUF4340)
MALPQFWKTYAALAVLAGLGAYIYFVESKKEEKPEKAKEKVFQLQDAKTKVKELTLAPADGERIKLVKMADGWRMAEPVNVPADGTEADSLVTSLESLELDEVVSENASNLGEYGLEKPKSTVQVLVQGASEPSTLLVGAKTPDGNSLYAKLPARPRVFTIPSYVESSFSKKPFDFRDRSVLHVKRDDVKGLEVTGPEGSYALTRDEKGEWAFTKPVSTRAGRWSVDGLLGTLEGLRMESVAAEDASDLKPYGLDKPTRTVTLRLADGSSKILEIGSSLPEKKYNVRDSGSRLVAVVPGALVDDLAKGMGELRAKRLLEVATYEVEGLQVQIDGGKKSLLRTATKDKDGVDVYKWRRTAPDNKEVDTNKVQDALFQVGSVEVEEFLDKPEAAGSYGFDKPRLRVDVQYGPSKPASWFEVGEKNGAFYGRRNGDEAVMRLEAKKAEELVKTFKEL